MTANRGRTTNSTPSPCHDTPQISRRASCREPRALTQSCQSTQSRRLTPLSGQPDTVRSPGHSGREINELALARGLLMARRMRTWPETYAKEVLGTTLEFRGQVITEYELVERRQRADMLFVPDPEPPGRENT
jgi:hypothetical protein